MGADRGVSDDGLTQPDAARHAGGILAGTCLARAVLPGSKVQQKARRALVWIKEQIPFIRLQGCRLDPMPLIVNQFHALIKFRGRRLTIASQKIGCTQGENARCQSDEISPSHATVHEMGL